jgi:hypothetical protein
MLEQYRWITEITALKIPPDIATNPCYEPIYSSQTLQENAGYYFKTGHDHFPIRPKFVTVSPPLSILRGLAGDKSSFYELMQGHYFHRLRQLTSTPLNHSLCNSSLRQIVKNGFTANPAS